MKQTNKRLTTKIACAATSVFYFVVVVRMRKLISFVLFTSQMIIVLSFRSIGESICAIIVIN